MLERRATDRLPPEERHVVPAEADPPHRLDGFCWCSPTVEEVIAAGRIYVHRQTVDSARYEARLT